MAKKASAQINWTQKVNDKLFKRLFTFLLTLALLLAFVLSVHLFAGVSLGSAKLWTGAILPFLFINILTNVRTIHTKLIVLGVSILVMGLFFHAILNWSLTPSLFAGGIILIMSVLLYMTFIS